MNDTKPVRPGEELSAANLQAFLCENLNLPTEEIEISQFPGGSSNLTYCVRIGAGEYVLRRPPFGNQVKSAHDMSREFNVLSRLSTVYKPAPKPLVYCADDSVTGTVFYVMRFVDGRVFWEPDMPGSDPAERAAVYDAMNAALARLHCFDPAAIGLGDFGKPENYVGRQVDRWSRQYRASQTEPIAEMDKLMDRLPAHLPPPVPARLVHGDYRLDNMIVHAREPKILAVLDWELSTLGDPLADFTYHLMAWHMPHSESAAGTGSLVGHDLRALGIPSMTDYVDAYVARTGLDPRPSLPVYLAYNFFRIAAILQGIIGRVRDGTATSEHAPAKAEMIRPLAEKAWEFAEAAGA